jgi:hypothetical protein
MTIIKIQKRDPGYAQIDNKVLGDSRLSWKAKGVLVYLLSKPNDWQVQITDIVNHSPDGESSVRSAIDELMELGYIKREKQQSKNVHGQWLSYDYTVYEQPYSGFPHTDKPDTENRPLSNKELTNTDSTNTEEDIDSDSTLLLLQRLVGLLAMPTDIPAINELDKLGVTEDDIRGALQWRKDNNLGPVKRLSQIFEGIKTNRAKRVQGASARAPNHNGKKPIDYSKFLEHDDEDELVEEIAEGIDIPY